MPHDAHHAILCQRAGGPRLFPMLREPVVRRIVLNMRGVNQRNQHVYIKQKSHPGNSSRSWFTNSGVTAAAPARTGNKGTPLRALAFCALGRSAFRVSSEITSPTVLRCKAAKLFAARSEEHTSELQSQFHLVCRLLLEKKRHRRTELPRYPRRFMRTFLRLALISR